MSEDGTCRGRHPAAPARTPPQALRLPTMLREYDRVARQCAVEDVDYPRYLLRMAELELLDRERRATERRIRQAKFRSPRAWTARLPRPAHT